MRWLCFLNSSECNLRMKRGRDFSFLTTFTWFSVTPRFMLMNGFDHIVLITPPVILEDWLSSLQKRKTNNLPPQLWPHITFANQLWFMWNLDWKSTRLVDVNDEDEYLTTPSPIQRSKSHVELEVPTIGPHTHTYLRKSFPPPLLIRTKFSTRW